MALRSYRSVTFIESLIRAIVTELGECSTGCSTATKCYSTGM